MKMLKKLGIASYLSLATLVLLVVSWIIYGVSVGSAGYFHGVSVPFVVLFNVFSLVLLLAVIGLDFVPAKDGIIGKIIPIVQAVLAIGVIVFMMSNSINIIGARAEGLGYIFFSNADVSAEVQTPENLSSAALSITSFVFYLVTWLVAVVTPFFSFGKKKAEAAE